MRGRKRSQTRATLVLASVAALLFTSATASAYCRTTTIPVRPDFSPAAGTCWDEGVPLYHPSRCATYRLRTADSAVIPNAALRAALDTAFGAWTAPNPRCTPGIDVIELAPLDTPPRVEYLAGGTNSNLVIVAESWPYEDQANTLALTTLTFRADTGTILDVDMEIDGERRWSVDGAPASDEYDLSSAVTHEAGHFLGFAHVSEPSAIMNASYEPGSTAGRTLTDDEHAAVCAVYPNSRERLTGSSFIASTPCELTVGNPAGATCVPDITHGCSFGPTPTTEGGLGGLLLALATGAIARRRRTAG